MARAGAEVEAVAHYVTAAAGGNGAVREAIELLLHAQGLWEDVLRRYEIG